MQTRMSAAMQTKHTWFYAFLLRRCPYLKNTFQNAFDIINVLHMKILATCYLTNSLHVGF